MESKEIILESQLEAERTKLTFIDLLNKVAIFQKATDQPVNTEPTLPTYEYAKLRYSLMEEENLEYLQGCKDKVEILDSVVDQMYVLLGTINSAGLGNVFLEAFNRVHNNNLSKIVDGKVLRNSAGKIIKPENFQPVDLTDLV